MIEENSPGIKFSSVLILCTLGKIFSRWYFDMFFLFIPDKRIWHFMQIVSNGDNLHEMSDPVFWKNIINLLSAEFAQRVVMVKEVWNKNIQPITNGKTIGNYWDFSLTTWMHKVILFLLLSSIFLRGEWCMHGEGKGYVPGEEKGHM